MTETQDRETREVDEMPFCSACSEPVAETDGVWEHLDAAVAADCADARGDQKIIPLAGHVVFSAVPYEPRAMFRPTR